ncbi:MAG: ABC transporter permease subunit [Anaerolineaceae bacterium]|nr:ABC transporter permease subunit [Anaerolineaceae bacterium]
MSALRSESTKGNGLDRVRTIVEKEWAEVFKNRVVLLTVGILPLVLTILPIVILATFRSTGAGAGDSADVPLMFSQMCGNIAASDCMHIYILNQFLIMFMIMPLSIPIAIAAYSIVGEKTTRSLEPLLATPITTEELLTGKALAAVIPAIAATWISFFIFAIAAPLTGASPAVVGAILSPTWLVAILLVGPLMAVLAVNFAILVSSRASDPRVAEQISMVIIVPLLVLLFGQIAGLLVVNAKLMLGVAAVIALVDVGVIYLGAQLFQRETILTKWK